MEAQKGRWPIAAAARMAAMFSALLVIPLGFANWVRVCSSGLTGESCVYVSGRSSDVVFPPGDAYAIAALGAIVVLARIARTIAPRLDVFFPWVCIICGLGITVVGGAVLMRDWAGERMWTIWALPVLGIVIAISGGILLSTRQAAAGTTPEGEATGAR